jgi:hypothetical protein
MKEIMVRVTRFAQKHSAREFESARMSARARRM